MLTSIAPTSINRANPLASDCDKGSLLNFSANCFHSFIGYRKRQLSSPLVITAFLPKSSRNFPGIANRFFSSIEYVYSPMNITNYCPADGRPRASRACVTRQSPDPRHCEERAAGERRGNLINKSYPQFLKVIPIFTHIYPQLSPTLPLYSTQTHMSNFENLP